MTEIRPLTDADIDAVAAMHVRSWQVGYAGIVPADYLDALDPAEFAARRRAQGRPPGARSVVAVDDGRVIGFANFGPDLDDPAHGGLYALYVDPDDWRRGAGRLLLEAAKAGLAAAGFGDMRLWVLEQNERGRRFYERAGLSPDGTRQTWTPRRATVELPELRYATAL